MKLYNYWRSSSSWRVRIALELKGLVYEYVPVNLIARDEQAQLTNKNPMLQVPVLEIEHDGRTVHLAQSLPIIEYLDERFAEPALVPRDALDRAQARQLAEIVNAGIQPLQNSAVLLRVAELTTPAQSREFAAHFIARGLAALEAQAVHSAGRFLVGDRPSVADLFLVPQLYNARRSGLTVTDYATLSRVEHECEQLEAFQKAHPDRQPDFVPNAPP
jgi:maleylpyruvate isomerase